VTSHSSHLKGLRVFFVEDEFIILVMLEDMLHELGCDAVGSASRLADALAVVADLAIDVAVLDINLAGTEVYPLADVLAARHVPIIFSTGYGRSGLSLPWQNCVILQKPYHLRDLSVALTRATAKSRVS
jgi:CheY-like chemotaxis protein